MRSLTPAGQKAIHEIAQRHQCSVEAATSMLDSLIAGNGSMAQFSHPEFGGSGQWMRGGMTMVSDLFNHSLKAKVDGLCADLSRLLASDPGLLQTGSFQSQSQGGRTQTSLGNPGQQQQQSGGGTSAWQGQGSSGPQGSVSLFVPEAPGASRNWWPDNLGSPTSVGGKNNVRYAYFPQTRRLAVDTGDRLDVYDTLDHQISGFSQQQSRGGSLSFHSQHGLVDLASLPLVPESGATPAPGKSPSHPAPEKVSHEVSASTTGLPEVPASSEADVFASIEKLAGLWTKGLLTEEQFNAKRDELLARI